MENIFQTKETVIFRMVELSEYLQAGVSDFLTMRSYQEELIELRCQLFDLNMLDVSMGILNYDHMSQEFSGKGNN